MLNNHHKNNRIIFILLFNLQIFFKVSLDVQFDIVKTDNFFNGLGIL